MVPIDHNGFWSFVYYKFRLLTREVKASILVLVAGTVETFCQYFWISNHEMETRSKVFTAIQREMIKESKEM